VKLYTYKRAWDVDTKIYSFQNLRLPRPVSISAIAYFAISCGVMFVMTRTVPVVAKVPPILIYGAIPFLFTEFMRKKKFDGKPPHVFLKDYVIYLAGRKTNIELFRKAKSENAGRIKLDWACTCRNS
jgi:hypothetical protein